MCEHNLIFEGSKKCDHKTHPDIPECLICSECGDMIPWSFQKEILLKKILENYEKIFMKGE